MKKRTTLKTFLSLTLVILFFSCNSTTNKSEDDSTAQEVAEIEDKELQNESGLKQNGDYSALFNKDKKDCQLLSVEEMAEAMDIPVSGVAIEDNGLSNCNYIVTIDGVSTRFHFKVEEWGENTTMKEIKTAKENQETFGKDSKLSQYRISETGDTYLSMHQNRMVRILNENNENAIIILYSANIAPDESDVEKINKLKKDARNRAYSIANYALKKYKK